MALPHIKNSQAGVNKYDAVFGNIYELFFSLPEPLVAQFQQDEALITEHVLKVSGIEALDKAPEIVQQEFMGTKRSHIAPRIDDTSAEISVDFSINLRNGVDNYIYKLFKAWARLGYNINTGERTLKKDYCAPWMRLSIANQAGDIYREIIFKDIMISGPIDGMGEYEYSNSEVKQITVKFKSDWWKEVEL